MKSYHYMLPVCSKYGETSFLSVGDTSFWMHLLSSCPLCPFAALFFPVVTVSFLCPVLLSAPHQCTPPVHPVSAPHQCLTSYSLLFPARLESCVLCHLIYYARHQHGFLLERKTEYALGFTKLFLERNSSDIK